MTLKLDLPEDLAEHLRSGGRDLRQAALESFAVDEYRAQRLSDAQFRRILNLSRLEADQVLKDHGVWLDYTMDDFMREGSPSSAGMDATADS